MAALTREEVRERIARGESLAGEDYSHCDLSDLDLSGQDLSDATLTRANLKGAGLKGADLSDAYVVEIDGNGADFSGAVCERYCRTQFFIYRH